jgi:hypothetical protein
MANITIQNNSYDIIEKLITAGDLSTMTTKDRVTYYRNLCDSEKLNPLTKPFEYIKLNGKLVLYATKNCAEQLRNNKGISIYKVEKEVIQDVLVVTVYARDKDGREDISTGAVCTTNLKGDALANAFLKCETKAKRRVTLSLAGLGFLDETEVATIPNAEKVVFPEEEPAKVAKVELTELQSAENLVDWFYKTTDNMFIQLFIDKLNAIKTQEDLEEMNSYVFQNKSGIAKFCEDFPEFQQSVKIIKEHKIETFDKK